MQDLPDTLKTSITWDQGKKMARCADFTAKTGTPVYFCDPHSPWQRHYSSDIAPSVRP
jgi:IS30 family transposase